MDILTASAITAGAYQRALDNKGLKLDFSKANPDAVAEAQRILRQTQASAFFKDVPLAISRGKLTGNRSFDKALLQFQTFLLGRWSRIRHDAYRAGLKTGNVSQFVNIMAWLSVANVAELGIRRLSKEAISLLVSALTGEEPDLEPFEDRFTEELVKTVLGNIPIVSNLIGVSVYGGQALPAVDLPARAGKGIKQLITGKSTETKIKGAIKALLFTAGFGFGIPGVRQAEQLIREFIDQTT